MTADSTPRRSRMAGFTLLELIVAAGILALIAVFSWRGLDALIREREAIAASQASIDLLQRSFARIERDALSAADVQVDDPDGSGGTLRFVAGTSSVDGTPAASVEYRLIDGALTRSVEGVDRAPLVMLDHLASLTMEAWQPSPKGGAWVRTRGPAMEAPAASAQAGQGGNAPSTAATVAPATPVGTSQPNVATNAPQQPAAAVAVATGVRFTLARPDGQQVVRSFMVGGG